MGPTRLRPAKASAKWTDPKDMIYDHDRWFDLGMNDRHYLLEELRRMIPEKADPRDASTMAWNILRGFLRHMM